MKSIHLLLMAILMIPVQIFAQATLEIKITNIRKVTGTIRIGLFTNENDFLKKAALGKVVKADGKEVTVVFENLEAGNYALSVFHDENENGKLDQNIIGIPKEGFAFGNNAMGMFGPPSFKEAKVTLHDNGNHKQSVRLKHF